MRLKPVVGRAAAARTAVTLLLIGHAAAAASPEKATRVKLAAGDYVIPQLALGLGHFKQEGLEVTIVDAHHLLEEDWRSTELLNKGELDAEVNWFHRVIYGIGNKAPAKAVILFEDTPGMAIMVANTAKGTIRSAADFKGRRIAQGAGYSTKSYLTSYLATKAGLPPNSYTPVAVEVEGRQEAIVKGLKEGGVDLVVSMEPLTSDMAATHLVSPLYDLVTKEGTRKALGDVWPARCLYVAPGFIKAHPETVQRLVNAFVRTMRYVNSHSPEEIADHLPAAYLAKVGRARAIDAIRRAMPTFTKGDYSMPASAARLEEEVVFSSGFDDSGEGRYRASAKAAKVPPEQTYDNTFVQRAMRQIP
jgi:NitT/TauT family transport system substrate-binding protein